MAELDRYLEEHRGRFEEELCELLRIPSVSTDGLHQAEIHQAAQWVADQFRAMGLQGELLETSGNPVVYAESPPVPGAPTVLVYGHYDVQPPDPLDEWLSPALRADASRRQSLRARRNRRQGADADPRQERGGLDEDRRQTAASS